MMQMWIAAVGLALIALFAISALAVHAFGKDLPIAKEVMSNDVYIIFVGVFLVGVGTLPLSLYGLGISLLAAVIAVAVVGIMGWL